MNANIDITSLILFLISTAYFSTRHLSQLRQLKTQQVLIIAHFVGCAVLMVCEALLLADLLSLHSFESVFKSILVGVFSINLTLISLISIKALSKKKIKTLWRIPLTGFFAGLYFELKYIPIICLGYFVLCFVVLWPEREKYRYLFSKLLLFAPAMIGIFYISMNFLSSLNIIFLWLNVSCSFIMTSANINSNFKTEEKVE